MGPKYKRKRLWVDPAFQSRLLVRLCLHLLLFAVAVVHITFIFELMGNLALNRVGRGFGALYLEFLSSQKPLLVTLVLFTPILLYDLLKFSNRIAGPLYRCRNVMQMMARGEPVPQFQPRKHDLMRDLFQAFNALITAWNAQVSTRANGYPPNAIAARGNVGRVDTPPEGGFVADPEQFKV
jgi:hypothetical protein